ncbi:MAG: rhodanese-like domain-containing protein [Bacteroidales bacterium]|nr:rhodanese-like domain-containing protein [Bacteroidales bacterium]
MNLSEKPTIQDFQLEGVKHITVTDAYDLIVKDQVFFIDVREPEEQAKEFFNFQNVLFFPMSSIMENIHLIPKEIPLIVVCDEGIRSTKIVNVLNRQDYTSVANLDGGIYAWKTKGLPISKGMVSKSGISDPCDSGCSECGCDGCG